MKFRITVKDITFFIESVHVKTLVFQDLGILEFEIPEPENVFQGDRNSQMQSVFIIVVIAISRENRPSTIIKTNCILEFPSPGNIFPSSGIWNSKNSRIPGKPKF